MIMTLISPFTIHVNYNYSLTSLNFSLIPKKLMYGIGKIPIILYENLSYGNVPHKISKQGLVKQNALFEFLWWLNRSR